MNFDIVIAGAGQAGFQLAASLRQEGFTGSILMIGDEPGLPYQRPPLSKAFLKDGNEDRLQFRPASFFESNDIRIEDGVRVTGIKRRERRVALEDGRHFGYGHLVLATGTRNRRLPVEGAEDAGLLELRSLSHARAIRRRLGTARSLVVVGGGFIGLEVAATARAAGLEVTVVEATHRLMSRVVSAPVSGHFLGLHRAAGIELRLETVATRFREGTVELSDGTRVAADMVLVAAGVVPNAELAEAAGLYVHDGIRVDDLLATEDPAISAIGDCASFPYGQDGLQVRLESVQNAVDQAKCLASRLVGRSEPYRALPWFWSDQGPHKLQIAGVTAGADRHEVRLAQEDGRLTVFCFRRGELIGVETVNMPANHMAARKLMSAGPPLSYEKLHAADFDIAALYREVSRSTSSAA